MVHRTLVRSACWAARRLAWLPGRWRLLRWIDARHEAVSRLAPGVVRLRRGIRMWLDPRDFVSRDLYIAGEYEPPVARVFDALVRPDDVVFDVGANIGFFSLLSARRIRSAAGSGQVHAFEASPPIQDLLRRNLALNNADNVTLHPLAVCDHDGTAQFHTAAGDYLGLSSLRALDGSSTTTHTVRCARPDSLRDLPPPTLLKIDVEGAEMQVLQGARGCIDAGQPWIIFELTDAYLRQMGSSSTEILRWLTDRGYALHHIATDGLHPLDPTDRRAVNVLASPSGRTPPPSLQALLAD
ncbi:MAG: FkbM family methyltransferase [Planctomycetes bacterium]|nr:FkbM family methyltransferase [Planctomycetota bacterium]